MLSRTGSSFAAFANATAADRTPQPRFEQARVGTLVDTILGASRPFSEHIEAALRDAVAERGLDAGRIDEALEAARALPAYPATGAGLAALASAGHRLAVLTNSGADADLLALASALD